MSFASAKHKLAFIHIVNAGGTSIQASLEKGIAPNDLRICPGIPLADKIARKLANISALLPPFPSKGLGRLKYMYATNGGHLQLKDYLWYAPEFSKDATFFAVVRNPYTQVVATYSYQQKRGAIARDITVDEYVRQRCCEDIHCFDQTEFLTDFTGNVSVTRILRYENLGEDYARLMADLLGTQLPLEHLNRRPVDLRRLELSQTSRALVRTKFHRDFKNFYPSEL